MHGFLVAYNAGGTYGYHSDFKGLTTNSHYAPKSHLTAGLYNRYAVFVR